MRTTLKHIAEYLNVSITTVSRALNDKSDISPQMRQKVLEVARMLDYKPNSIAISLRKKTTSNVLGVIIPTVDHYFFSTILRGVTTTGFRDDYMVMIGESNHDVQREKEIINRFNDHYVSGIIYVPSRHSGSKQNVLLLQERKTPFVLIDRTFKNFEGSYIQHDDFEGEYAATKHLIDRGRSKIALLRGDNECSVSEARFQGYRSALKNHNLEFSSNLVISCTNATKEEGAEATKRLIESSEIDGIVCITDQLAAGALEYALSEGIHIPKDLSIVGYSNSEISQNVTPKLTTISQDGYEMGKLAKEALIEICHYPNIVHQKTFAAELIIRDSS